MNQDGKVENDAKSNSLIELQNDNNIWGVTFFFAVLWAGLLILGKFDRVRFDAMMWEDSVGEWATFFAFAMAGVIGFGALFRAIRSGEPKRLKNNRFWYLLTIAGLSAFCLAAAGEEISWGQRIFGFLPSAFFQEFNFQQESNIHNILAYVVSPRLIVAIICFGYGVALPIVAHNFSATGESNTPPQLTGFVAPQPFLMPWFLLTGIAYWTDWPLPMVSAAEAVEMVLGLLLLADVLAKAKLLGVGSAGANGSIKPILVLLLAIVLGFVANPLLETFWFSSDPAKIELARNELVAIGRDLEEKEGVDVELIRSNQLVGSRIYNATRSGWLYFEEHGHFREKSPQSSALVIRQTYFIDPWNCAYWIRMRGLGPIFLYSFGPNRRLDTVMDHIDGVPKKGELKGDDVGIWIDPFRRFREQ